MDITRAKPTVVVGLDFGTTYSGFAYALVSEPETIYKFYEWPSQGLAGGKNYCKTQSSLLYSTAKDSEGSYVLEHWGYAALANHHNVRNSNKFITAFKLHLAGKESSGSVSAAIELPRGLTIRRVITDYLRNLSEFVMIVLEKNLGRRVTMLDVQWCLTVPAIWDEPAKQEMKTCAEIAGLLQGQHCADGDASPHPVIIVLEPEAASVYCQKTAGYPLTSGDKFLVVDIGGGTVDLVLHEKVGAADDLKVREVSPSSGGLCGGTYVDKRFLKFLSRKIKCFPEFAEQHPQSVLKLTGWWENIKHGFDGDMPFPYEMELPAKLARAWEADEKSKKLQTSLNDSFDSIDVLLEDILGIFDPVINKILHLIESRLNQIKGLKVIMIVGGFAASPYLVQRIKKAFSWRVEAIIIPNEPGSAICCGAVSYGFSAAEFVMSRISKLTYGIELCRPFVAGDPKHLLFRGPKKVRYCEKTFSIYVRKGALVNLDECVSHVFQPLLSHETRFQISLYCTTDSDPRYVNGLGVRELGSFTISFPSEKQLGRKPEIKVSMYFGRTLIEVKAVGENFGDGEVFELPPVTFERSFD